MSDSDPNPARPVDEPSRVMIARFQTSRRVEFRDTDAAGIMHFSAFFPMLESVEHEFLRSLGIEVLPDHADPEAVTWPRISAACDYRGPARFEDLLRFDLFVDKVGQSSVHYRTEITCDDSSIATGKIVAVCCRLGSGGRLQKTKVPEPIRRKLLGVSPDCQ